MRRIVGMAILIPLLACGRARADLTPIDGPKIPLPATAKASKADEAARAARAQQEAETANQLPPWLGAVLPATIGVSVLLCGLVLWLVLRSQKNSRVAVVIPEEVIPDTPPGLEEHPMVSWIAGRSRATLAPKREKEKAPVAKADAPLPALPPTGLWLAERAARRAGPAPEAPTGPAQSEPVMWLVTRPTSNPTKPVEPDPWDESLFSYGEHPTANWLAQRAQTRPQPAEEPGPSAEAPPQTSQTLWLLSRPVRTSNSPSPQAPAETPPDAEAPPVHMSAQWLAVRAQAKREADRASKPAAPTPAEPAPLHHDSAALWLVQRNKRAPRPPQPEE